MPKHSCVDPHDQYAQAEVLVEFETVVAGVRLISVRNALHDDILSDLEDIQRRALETEILDDYPQDTPSP